MTGIKRIIAVLLLAICVSCCAFAATNVGSTEFKMFHVVNVTKEYYFEFWNPATNSRITESVLQKSGRQVFATLMIFYTSRTQFSNITVSFTDLLSSSGDYYPYTMEVLVPNTNTSQCTINAVENGHGAGSAVLFDSTKTFFMYSPDTWNYDEVVDLAITLDDSDVAYGSYVGNITIAFVAL